MRTSETDSTNPKDLIGLKKTPLRLVPPALMIFVAHVMALGAKKYGPWNWRANKVRHTVYLEAAIRHLQAALDGEDTDPESGLPHEAHAAACMGIILDAKQLDCLLDDRNKSGYVQRLMDSLIEKTYPMSAGEIESKLREYRDKSFHEAIELISSPKKETHKVVEREGHLVAEPLSDFPTCAVTRDLNPE